MAKRRFGRKVRKAGRKSLKRVRAGRKAWRTKVRRYGSKAAAIAATFGKRRRRRGSKRRATRKSVRRVGRGRMTKLARRRAALKGWRKRRHGRK